MLAPWTRYVKRTCQPRAVSSPPQVMKTSQATFSRHFGGLACLSLATSPSWVPAQLEHGASGPVYRCRGELLHVSRREAGPLQRPSRIPGSAYSSASETTSPVSNPRRPRRALHGTRRSAVRPTRGHSGAPERTSAHIQTEAHVPSWRSDPSAYSALMAFLGPIPSEHFSGQRRRQGAFTKTGDAAGRHGEVWPRDQAMRRVPHRTGKPLEKTHTRNSSPIGQGTTAPRRSAILARLAGESTQGVV